ncbi:uncharacterized protein LOC124606121 [Schistocerca americana]|uniref:uncharacterized protein LOC124606121 n=1 Tax=Schistocerca americana TaxID=7009 RepID=UPI001F4FD1D0|nr:uncharacterized protein LOC124606121 [Schistocerca americana]
MWLPVKGQEKEYGSKLYEEISPLESVPVLLVDNASAIKLAKNPEFHKRSKHIDVRMHYIPEKIQEGQLDIEHVPGNQQAADNLTKPLPNVQLKYEGEVSYANPAFQLLLLWVVSSSLGPRRASDPTLCSRAAPSRHCEPPPAAADSLLAKPSPHPSTSRTMPLATSSQATYRFCPGDIE